MGSLPLVCFFVRRTIIFADFGSKIPQLELKVHTYIF